MTWDYEKYIKEKRERIIKDGESFQEQWVYCPYCGFDQDDAFIRDEDREENYDCERCKKIFAVRAKTVYSTRVLK